MEATGIVPTKLKDDVPSVVSMANPIATVPVVTVRASICLGKPCKRDADISVDEVATVEANVPKPCQVLPARKA